MALVVLSSDLYSLVEEDLKGALIINADEVLRDEKAEFIRDIVKAVSGCNMIDSVVERLTEFVDGYAVAAALVGTWLRERCGTKEVVEALEWARGSIHKFVLGYVWWYIFGGNYDEAGAEKLARDHVPLIVATGLLGPHPPKFGRLIIEVFGGTAASPIVDWLTSMLHGVVEEGIRRIVEDAITRAYGSGEEKLCNGEDKGPCRLVEICAQFVRELGGKSREEVAERLEMRVVDALTRPGKSGGRPIDRLINDFVEAHNGERVNGRWRLRYPVKASAGVVYVEEEVDELDILLTLYGLASLYGVYNAPNLGVPKRLAGWVFVGGIEAADELHALSTFTIFHSYVYPLILKRRKELAQRAVERCAKIGRGLITSFDIWHAMGTVTAMDWSNATDEELAAAVKLATLILDKYATIIEILFTHFYFLFEEAWHRIEKGAKASLADAIAMAANVTARGWYIYAPTVIIAGKNSSNEVYKERYEALYRSASNAGKLALLELLFAEFPVEAAVLLNARENDERELLREVTKRVDSFVATLYGAERWYVASLLYPRLATLHAQLGEVDSALKYIEGALDALTLLEDALTKRRNEVEGILYSYLEMRFTRNIDVALEVLRFNVYVHSARVHMVAGNMQEAKKFAELACKSAERLDAYNEVVACSLQRRLAVIESGVPPLGDFEQLWHRALDDVGTLGVEVMVTTLGQYLVALASMWRLGEVAKLLEKWWPVFVLGEEETAITYGVLSLFDTRYLRKVMAYLPAEARDNLPTLAYALREAFEAGLFSEDLHVDEGAWKRLLDIYGYEVTRLLVTVAWNPSYLFLLVLVGLAYCRDDWGLILARLAARIGSLFKTYDGRLFGELATILEKIGSGECLNNEVMKFVYKLYYYDL